MISIKETETTDGKVLAACDEELLGKNFKETGRTLEVRESFYGGKIVTIEEFSDKLQACTIANLVGDIVVGKALELGLVAESSVIRIQNVPHAQILFFKTA
ncbi:MAG: DUF424 family protein [archaeon]